MTETDTKTETDANNKAPLPEKEELRTGLGLSDDKIHEIEDALESNYEEVIIDTVSGLGDADAAELLAKVKDENRDRLLKEHGAAFNPDVFAELAPELRKQYIKTAPAKHVAAIISELESDDALDIIENLDSDTQEDIIRNLSAKLRITLKEGLNFPEESAGRLMQREFVAIPQFWTVGKTTDYLRAAAQNLPDKFSDIFVITPTYHVVGEIPLNRLICTKHSEKLETLTQGDIHPIPARMDQEEVARVFQREDLLSAPVVDEESRLIGVITIDDVVDVIHEEAEEDILKLGGVEKGDLYHALLSTTGSRFRWLFLNLMTAILASIVISFFEGTIQEIVALAILMPIVASMGGNAGTQALTVAVRALATRELSETNALRVIGKETIIGTLNGAAFAVIMGVVAALWFSSNMLGLVIAAAMIINLIIAGLFGAGIPIVLHRMGSDPAISSTVLLTTATDITGFLAFLGLAAIFLT